MMSDLGTNLTAPKPECDECSYVSRLECSRMMEGVNTCLQDHDDRLHKKDVQDAKILTRLGIQTWFLGGIFSVLLVAVIEGIFSK